MQYWDIGNVILEYYFKIGGMHFANNGNVILQFLYKNSGLQFFIR